MFTAADVSVVIPSYNSRATIEACINSLLEQDALPLEIIVVDSSIDDTPKFISQRFPFVKLRLFKRQKFPGPARNQGVKAACGSIIAFIDADCQAARDWVRSLVADHNAGYQVVGGAITVGNPDSPVAWAGHLGEFREFSPWGKPRYVLHVPTCNISYRKELFEKHGGFPDAYYPQEDLLFNYLLNQQGVRIWFDPDLRIRHFCREDLRSYLSHQHRIGRVTRSTLMRIELSGSFVARRGWLARLASPVLGAMKFFRTAAIFAFRNPSHALRHPGVLGLLALGSIWWARGFAAGAQKGLSGIKGWDDPEEPIFALLLTRKTDRE